MVISTLENIQAITNTVPSPDVSEKYGFMNTENIIDYLKTLDFEVVSAKQSGSWDPEKLAFKKHLVRFRKVNSQPVLNSHYGEIHPEIILINSHEGTTSLKLMFGLFRFACANGLIISSPTKDMTFKLRHNLINVEKINEGVRYITAHAAYVTEQIQKMQNVKMSQKDMLAFAEAAAKTKYKTETAPFDVVKLLEVKREVDKDNTLWNVFNRVQEHLVQGGIKGVSETGANIETRPINHIDKNIKVNTGLWSLAEQYLAA